MADQDKTTGTERATTHESEERARIKGSSPVTKPGTAAPQPAATDSGESKTK